MRYALRQREITWLYDHGGVDAGAGHRRNHGDLHAGRAGDVAIAAGHKTGSALAHRLPAPLLRMGWIQPGQRRRARAIGISFRMRHTSYSGQTRQDSRIWQRCRRVTSRWQCDAPAQRDRRRRRMASLFPELFSDAGCVGVARKAACRRRRPRGRASGGGDELSCVAGEVRLRSFGGGSDIPDQWPCVHDRRRGSGWFHWSEHNELGRAGSVDAGRDGAVDVRENGANEKSAGRLAGPDRTCASRNHPRALQAELQGELHGWLASHVADMSPQEKAVWQKQTLRVSPGGAGFSSLRRYYSESLLLLMVTACCVLLVACANIANLLLARGLRNRQQTAVRVALGASRGRLVRNALIESVTLSLIGGAASVAVAWAGARLILYLAFHTLEKGHGFRCRLHLRRRFCCLGLGVSLLTGVIFGVAPRG